MDEYERWTVCARWKQIGETEADGYPRSSRDTSGFAKRLVVMRTARKLTATWRSRDRRARRHARSRSQLGSFVPWDQDNNIFTDIKEANYYTRVHLYATHAFLLFLSLTNTVVGGAAIARDHPAESRWWSVVRIAGAGVVEAVLVFLCYNVMVTHLIGDIIMDWKEPGKLAACGDDCESNYGWH